jgi:hypothetical protein
LERKQVNGAWREGSVESDGFISVNDPQGRQPRGFRIRHGGDAEFNGIIARGEIHGERGTFKNGEFEDIIVRGNSAFEGNVSSGPLFASNFESVPGAGTLFTGRNIQFVLNWLGVTGPGQSVRRSFGRVVYSGVEGPAVIFASRRRTLLQDLYTLHIHFYNNRSFPIGTDVPASHIVPNLTIGGGAAGQTLVFNNLPTSGAGLPPGTVWRQSDGGGNSWVMVKD